MLQSILHVVIRVQIYTETCNYTDIIWISLRGEFISYVTCADSEHHS